MSQHIPLTPGKYFHVYNRGNNGENIFLEKRNYTYFLKLYLKYIVPIADTFAYCLMPNHFHFLIQVHDVPNDYEFERWQSFVSLQYSTFFSTYTKSFNKAYARHGSLFEKPFKRKLVAHSQYFSNLVKYIHHNPQRHGFVDNFREWHWSSYSAMLSAQVTNIDKDAVIEWFGGEQEFVTSHGIEADSHQLAQLVEGDWFD